MRPLGGPVRIGRSDAGGRRGRDDEPGPGLEPVLEAQVQGPARRPALAVPEEAVALSRLPGRLRLRQGRRPDGAGADREPGQGPRGRAGRSQVPAARAGEGQGVQGEHPVHEPARADRGPRHPVRAHQPVRLGRGDTPQDDRGPAPDRRGGLPLPGRPPDPEGPGVRHVRRARRVRHRGLHLPQSHACAEALVLRRRPEASGSRSRPRGSAAASSRRRSTWT